MNASRYVSPIGCSTLVVLSVLLTIYAGCQHKTQPQGTPGTGLTDQTIKRHNEAVALMGKFDYAAAHDALQQVVDQNSDWTDAKIDLAIAKMNRRLQTDSDDATSLLEAALSADPDSARAKFCLGLIFSHEGQIGRALPLFESVLQLDPRDAYAAYYAGQCSLDQGKQDQALEYFQKAQQLDPSLRSAYYGEFQTHQRLGQPEEAAKNLEFFQKLATNPQARLAEMKYSRMGPKADVRAATNRPIIAVPESGPLFADRGELNVAPVADGDKVHWASFADDSVLMDRPGTTVCDIDADGRLDLFIAGGFTGAEPKNGTGNAVLLRTRTTQFQIDTQHPLARVTAVNAALWGDFDNDGLVDVYLCRRGENQLWRQTKAGEWNDVTETTKTGGGNANTIDGGLFDADHDGDLDLFLLNQDGPNELLSNNLDGTFRPLAAELKLQGNGTPSTGIVVADLDADRDADIVVVHDQSPHEVFLNDRLWSYHPAEGWAAFTSTPCFSAVATDLNADGLIELLTTSSEGLSIWETDASGSCSVRHVRVVLPDVIPGPLGVQDFDGDCQLEALVTTRRGWSVVKLDYTASDIRGTVVFEAESKEATLGPVALAAWDTQCGPAIVAAVANQSPAIWEPGAGRFPFAAVEFSGKDNLADQMRSNASGIGIHASARIGTQSTFLQSFRGQSGPGQSRQPLLVGLAKEPAIDYVTLVWPDGLFQTETQLLPGTLHRIEETQRQVSSCPVVFVSCGDKMQFVSDILGVGGLGFNLANGEYGIPRPRENLLIPEGLLSNATRRGTILVAFTEPMEEACYLDSVNLVAYDLPPGWQMTLDERQATSDPQPTGDPIFYRSVIIPQRCVGSSGRDVTRQLATADLEAIGPDQLDGRFIGRAETFSIVLQFSEPLNNISDETSGSTSEVAAEPQFVLLADGWIEYPYSQTMFAAWQAGADYAPPTLEARSPDGGWQEVHAAFGYPAGMPRQMTLPIDSSMLPANTTQLRITTSMEIYWDRVAVICAERCPEARRVELRTRSADVREVGFARRSIHEHRRPDYDYSDRSPLWDARHQTGYYSNFGNALPLLRSIDDAVAIIGPGEELRLEVDTPNADNALPAGWTRRYVIEAAGWCKDMDLYTRDGETLEPLPRRSDESSDESGDERTESHRDHLHRQFNQRFRSG